MAVKVGSFAKSTAAATASQAITGVGFQPRALILWTDGSATAVDTWTDSYRCSIGFAARNAADTISVGSISGASADNLDTSNASKRIATKALTIVEWGEAVNAECDLASFDADGFTLSWTTNNATAYIINYMALGGADFTDAQVIPWMLDNATGNQSATGAGFQPDCVLHLAASVGGALPLTEAAARFSLGAMTSSAQWTATFSVADNSATSTVRQTAHDGYAMRGVSTSLSDYRFTYVSMDADGFTVSCDDAPAADYAMFSLCLAGGSYFLGSSITTSDVSPPEDQSFTGVGFQPEGLFSIGLQYEGTSLTGSVMFAPGAADGTSQRSMICWEAGALATSDCSGYAAEDALIWETSTTDRTIYTKAALKSLDADGFTVTKNPAGNANFIYLAFAGGAYATAGQPTMARWQGIPGMTPGRTLHGSGRGW